MAFKRLQKFDGRVALMRKLPDGRYEVIGDLVSDADEWNDAAEQVRRELEADDDVDPG